MEQVQEEPVNALPLVQEQQNRGFFGDIPELREREAYLEQEIDVLRSTRRLLEERIQKAGPGADTETENELIIIIGVIQLRTREIANLRARIVRVEEGIIQVRALAEANQTHIEEQAQQIIEMRAEQQVMREERQRDRAFMRRYAILSSLALAGIFCVSAPSIARKCVSIFRFVRRMRRIVMAEE